MKVTLYLPYYDYNDGEFDADESYYGEGEYTNAVYDDYMRNKDIVENTMYQYKNGSRDVFTGSDGKTYKFGANSQQKEDKVAYSSCEASLYNEDGEDESIDGIIQKFATQGDFVEMLELDMDTSEEDFETEYSIWSKEHKKIDSYRGKAGDAWVASKQPKRNVKMHFKNKANEDIYAILENCKIMDDLGGGTLIVYVEKISLIDKI